MRKGISITVTAADRARLDAIVRDRNSPQKHVWRARIVLLTADGQGTTAITRLPLPARSARTKRWSGASHEFEHRIGLCRRLTNRLECLPWVGGPQRLADLPFPDCQSQVVRNFHPQEITGAALL